MLACDLGDAVGTLDARFLRAESLRWRMEQQRAARQVFACQEDSDQAKRLTAEMWLDVCTAQAARWSAAFEQHSARPPQTSSNAVHRH